jgi:hypothetical protein
LLFALTLWSGEARAGVATSGAVLLDPFDPVPEIQFRHYGGYGYGYGCDYGCGGEECYDGCYRRRHWNARCYDDCGRTSRCGDRCDRHWRCDNDCGGRRYATELEPCVAGNCYDSERYERRWRNGDRVGREWFDHGRREKIIPTDAHPGEWDGHDDYDWRDHDSDGPPIPPPPPPPPPH